MTGANVTPITGKGRVAKIAPTTEAEAAEAVTAGPWPEVGPFDAAAPPPPFPTHTLPAPVAAFVEDQAATMGTAPDLVGSFALAVLSTLTGGRWKVERRPGWQEPLNIYTVVVAPSGSMKSAAMSAAVSPLVDIERELEERHGPEVAEAAAARDIDDMKLTALKKEAAAKGDKPDPERLREQALDLARDLATKPVPTVPSVFTTDATVEKAEELLEANGERYAWLDAEGGALTMAGGRYNSKGSGGSFDVFIKGHAADSIKVHRMGRNPITLRAPSLTLGIAVQPSHLMAATANAELMGRGLFARMLIAWPDLQPVNRSVKRPPPRASVTAAYAALVDRIYRAGASIDKDSRKVLTVDPDAGDVLDAFFQWTYEAQLSGGDLSAEGLDSWAAKLDGATLRLAGIFAVADDPGAVSVNLDAATRAVELARYYAEHARRTFGEVGLLPEVAAARKCWEAVVQARPRPGRWKEWPEVVTTRDVMESVRGSKSLGLDTSESVAAALERLQADYGLVRKLPAVTGKPGRPSERWEVHPDYRPET